MQTITEVMTNDFETHPLGTGAELARLSDQVQALADALTSMLNLEGPATTGACLGAWQGVDVPYHTDKARKALAMVNLT